MKLIKRTPKSWWTFYCPGCKCEHALPPRYEVLNPDTDTPTVTPAFQTTWREWGTSEKGGLKILYLGFCRITITAGQLIYAGGCTHPLKGKTVPMLDIPQEG